MRSAILSTLFAAGSGGNSRRNRRQAVCICRSKRRGVRRRLHYSYDRIPQNLQLRTERRPFECPLLAQSGHGLLHCKCPLSGVKRTCRLHCEMSAYDPKRTFTSRLPTSGSDPTVTVLPDLGPLGVPLFSRLVFIVDRVSPVLRWRARVNSGGTK
jgi:hypothetical protein